jgi:hypothetical protein
MCIVLLYPSEHRCPILSTLSEPLSKQLVNVLGHDHTADAQEFFHITLAERKAKREPDGVADDLPWEPMMFVQSGRG